MKRIIFIGWVLALADVAVAQDTESLNFGPEQIKKGSEIFAQNCEPCHGPRMADPQGAFDLRTFPINQHSRFVNSVTKGKNNMPAWGDLFETADIEALWAYVVAGEKSNPQEAGSGGPSPGFVDAEFGGAISSSRSFS